MGLAAARGLASQGAAVVIADIDGDAADAAAKAIVEEGGVADALQTDVGSNAALRAMAEFVDRRHGRLNIFFSNAGLGGARGFNVTEADFDDVFNINVKSHFFATNYVVPLMRTCAPHASIIYTSSIRGVRANADTPLYCMSKSTLLMMARTFALELGPAGIRVNALSVGAVHTAFPRKWMGLTEEEHKAVSSNSAARIPLGHFAEPADIAAMVQFLASDASRFVTGTTIPIDGGATAS